MSYSYESSYSLRQLIWDVHVSGIYISKCAVEKYIFFFYLYIFLFSDTKFYDNLDKMNQCPLNYAKWCVISAGEKEKCEKMMMAFGAKDLKPQLDCVLGKSTDHCMQLIRDGDADLMTLDAGDVYLGGEYVVLELIIVKRLNPNLVRGDVKCLLG